MHFRTVNLGALLLAGTALPTAVQAQATGTAPADAQSASDGGVADIVVTAQRRTESVQRAAIAISVVAPEALASVTRPDQLTNLAPALQIGTGSASNPVFYVRGVGSFAANPYTESAVAVNYDGVYLSRPTSSSGLFYDLERIEVLKGPQGTLYGRNATGGAINVIPAKPRLGESSLDLLISAGNYESINAQAAANLVLSDKAALRVSGIAYSHGPYMTARIGDERGVGGRVQLLVEPSSAISLRIAADYFKQGGTGQGASIYALRVPGTLQARRQLPLKVSLFDPRSIAILNSPAALFGPARAPIGQLTAKPLQDSQFYGISAELTADLGFAELTVLPSYRVSDLFFVSAAPNFQLGQRENAKQFSTEMRLAGKAGALDWLVGAYYFKENLDADFTVGARLYGGVQKIPKSDSQSLAGFGRLTFHVSDRFRLTGAARYTRDRKQFQATADSPLAICTLPPGQLCLNARRLPGYYTSVPAALNSIGFIKPPGSPVYIDALGTSGLIWSVSSIAVNDRQTSSKPTFRAAAEFDVAAQSLLYASVETGYRSGGFSVSSIKSSFDPETITAYTVGLKNRFFDNKLQFNIEAFYWQYRDQQLSHSAVSASGNQEFLTENVGDSTSKGVEVEIVSRPWRNTTIHLDGQYLDAKLKNFQYVDPDQSRLAGLPGGTIPPTTACAFSYRPTPGNYLVNCSGQRALRSPKWTLNFGVEQAFPLTDTMQIDLSFNTHFQTSQQLMFERLDIGKVGSYWKSDAEIGLSGTGRGAAKWSVSAFVNNIENSRKPVSLFLSPDGIIAANSGAPRTIGMRGRFNF